MIGETADAQGALRLISQTWGQRTERKGQLEPRVEVRGAPEVAWSIFDWVRSNHTAGYRYGVHGSSQ